MKVYFTGLNGLRFVAAAVVWFTHVNASVRRQGYDSIPQGILNPVTGKLGVLLFFVLSGFLITYLLLSEKKQTKTIAIKKFYVRRALRIWPLYYLMLIAGFFLFPVFLETYLPNYPIKINTDFNYYLALYVFLLPNLSIGAPLLAHFWSIGAEEQFYLVWPVLLKFFSNIYYICISIIITYYILLVVTYLNSDNVFVKSIFRLLNYSRFDGMAIGGIFGAALFYKNTYFLNIATSKITLIVSFLVFIFLYFIPAIISILAFTLFAVLFGILILNVAIEPNFLKYLRSKGIDYLGRISYGLYVFHPLAIIIVIIMTKDYISKESLYLFYFTVLVFSGALTIIFASLSYFLFEKYFLRFKRRFTVIPSGDHAR